MAFLSNDEIKLYNCLNNYITVKTTNNSYIVCDHSYINIYT